MRLLCLLMACLCLPLLVLAADKGRRLVVQNPQTGACARLPLEGVERVTIRFFHSYDWQWVEESFKVAGGRFVPCQVTYRDDSYDYRDQRYQSQARVGRELVRLSHIQPRDSDLLARIATRVAHIKSQQLILHHADGNACYAFTQWGSPGQPLVFSIE